MKQAKTEEQKNSRFPSREFMRMIGIFAVVLIISALWVNQSVNAELQIDTAEDVSGDVEDIADEVFEALELIEDAGGSITTALADSDGSVDSDSLIELVQASVDEEAIALLNTVAIAANDETTTLTVTDANEIVRADEAQTMATSDISDISDETWLLNDDTVRYVTSGEGVTVALTTSTAVLNDVLAAGAEREDLFEATASGYVVVVAADDMPIARYNISDVSPASLDSLQSAITENAYDEEGEYYSIDSDPLIDGESFVAMQTTDIVNWSVIGGFPLDEVPSLNIIESTVNLFEVTELGDSVSRVVERSVNFLNEDIGWLFRGLRFPIEVAIDGIEGLLLAAHWSIIIALTTAVAYFAGGNKVAYIATLSMFAIGMLGLWDLTMTTLAMLLTSMAFCVVVGIPLGIWSARSDTVNGIVRSILDAMQTIHPFVYLVPIVVLFGIGKVPGTIATIIFALPPMVRLTNLGIRQVPEDVVEAAKSFGSSDWQLLRDVQIPLALPSIMAGVNQTLMLSLSMVVIVALIAGGGLGQEIFRAIGRADTGRAVVAGVAVLLLAVTIDRISQGQQQEKEE